MADQVKYARIQLKHDTAANWANSNLTLLAGELALESDTGKFKFGDGTKKFSQLKYAGGAIVSTVDPTTAEAGSYAAGQLWLNTTSGFCFVDTGAAWMKLAKDGDAMHTADYVGNAATTAVEMANSIKNGDEYIVVDDASTAGLWTADKTSSYVASEIADAIQENVTDKLGVAGGIATLDTNGLVPSSQLPSYVDDVVEADSFADLPETGEGGKIYITIDDKKQFRWSGTEYVQITSGNLVLGETTGTAYEGSKGKANADAIDALEARMDTAEADIDQLQADLGTVANLTTEAKTAVGAINELDAAIDGLGTWAARSDTVKTADIEDGNVTDAKIDTMNVAKLFVATGDTWVINCGDGEVSA